MTQMKHNCIISLFMDASEERFFLRFIFSNQYAHVFILPVGSSKVQSFIITAVCLYPLNEKLLEWYFVFWNRPKLFHFNRKSLISLDHAGEYACQICSSTTFSTSDAFIMVQIKDDTNVSVVLGYCINVDHNWLHKSNKVFKFTILVGILRAYPWSQ